MYDSPLNTPNYTDEEWLEATYKVAEDLASAQYIFEHTLKAAHKAGVSLRKLAEAAGVSHTQVGNICKKPDAPIGTLTEVPPPT